MGYSLTRHSIIRNLPQLRQLAETRTTLRFPTDNPKRLAYKLREAVAACAAVEEYTHFFESINDNYKFREEGFAVVAEYFDVNASSADPASTPRAIPDKKIIAGISSLMDVLASAIKFSREAELFFPNAVLNFAEKATLYVWGEENGWSYIDHSRGGNSGLTLTKKEIPEGVAWHPESEEVSK